MGYIHAELMAQYAEDAKEHDRPWLLWERGDGTEWTNCTDHPCWRSDSQYRRKPRTVKVGDFEVPEPCKFPVYGQEYFVPVLASATPLRRTWSFNLNDKHALASNLVHLDQQSAALHAKALIEVSKGWWK